MKRELPAIHFTSQAEVRSNAEYRRAEDLTGLLKPLIERWSAGFRRGKAAIFSAVHYAPVASAAGSRGLPPRQS